VKKIGGVTKTVAPKKNKDEKKTLDPISGTWTGVMVIPAYKIRSSFSVTLTLKEGEVTGAVTTVMNKRKMVQPVAGTFDGKLLKIQGTQQGSTYSIQMKLVGPNHLKGVWSAVMGKQKVSGPVECRRKSGK
jgi:hypothetical protein